MTHAAALALAACVKPLTVTPTQACARKSLTICWRATDSADRALRDAMADLLKAAGPVDEFLRSVRGLGVHDPPGARGRAPVPLGRFVVRAHQDAPQPLARDSAPQSFQ